MPSPVPNVMVYFYFKDSNKLARGELSKLSRLSEASKNIFSRNIMMHKSSHVPKNPHIVFLGLVYFIPQPWTEVKSIHVKFQLTELS